MAKIDKQKEIVSGFKTAFFFLLATLFTIFAYVFQNYETLNIEKFFIIYFIVLGNIVVLMITLGKYKQNIDKLEDM